MFQGILNPSPIRWNCRPAILTFFCFISLLMFGSCQSNEKNQKTIPGAIGADAMAENATASADTSLMKLKADVGQYPSDINFLDQPELKQRLMNLLGSQYSNFRKYWQTETPIDVEDNILSTTGCEAHNCAANQFVLQIDLMHNNINVYHLGQGIQSYLEKGPIQLPPGLAKEFQILSANNSNNK